MKLFPPSASVHSHHHMLRRPASPDGPAADIYPMAATILQNLDPDGARWKPVMAGAAGGAGGAGQAPPRGPPAPPGGRAGRRGRT